MSSTKLGQANEMSEGFMLYLNRAKGRLCLSGIKMQCGHLTEDDSPWNEWYSGVFLGTGSMENLISHLMTGERENQFTGWEESSERVGILDYRKPGKNH